MDFAALLDKKKNKDDFSKDEVDFIVSSYANGDISDDEILELFKIINEDNFTYKETFYFADALASTGDRLNIASEGEWVVDKHSAGMVSDPSTLIFISVLASLGIKNVKILSDVYGSYGSTLDRFRVFKGFNADISKNELVKKLNILNAGIVEDVGNFVPIDKKFYELRIRENITSVPLVASSILSKKIAMGANVLVFDVKSGEGAIYPTENYASSLAKYLFNSAKLAGFKTVSVVTNLDQPLCSSIGPRSEIEETLNVLRCERRQYDSKLLDVAKELVVIALMLTKTCTKRTDASELFDFAIKSGKALNKFQEIIKSYGGAYKEYFNASERLLDGVAVSYVSALSDGYVFDIKINDLINAYKSFETKPDGSHDKNACLMLLNREGNKVRQGDKLVRVFYSIDNTNYAKASDKIRSAIEISKSRPQVSKVFHKIVV